MPLVALPDVLFFTGAALCVGGAALLSPAVGLLVAGSFLVVSAIGLQTKKGRRA